MARVHTLDELCAALEERDLDLVALQNGRVVWLYAPDDPALGVCVGEGDTLALAVAAAFEKWDLVTEPVDPSDQDQN